MLAQSAAGSATTVDPESASTPSGSKPNIARCAHSIVRKKSRGWTGHLLADEEHIDSAQIKVVEEWKGGQTVVGWMLARVELQLLSQLESWYTMNDGCAP